MGAATWHREMARWGRSRGRALTLCSRLDSTHRLALERLATGGPPAAPGWIFAFEQTAGEGRYGRAWVSPPGAGVYATYLLAAPWNAVGRFPMAVGVALCEALAGFGAPCRLKWPNDIQISGRKLGGILLQTRGGRPAPGVAASFGVNLHHRPEDLPRDDATSLGLALGAKAPSLPELSVALAESVERRFALLSAAASPDIGELGASYRALSAHQLGDPLTVTAGEERLGGSFAGFAEDGRLRLATAAGERLVSAGEIVP